MRTVSIGGVPEHKRQQSEELALLVARFNGQPGVQVSGVTEAPAEPAAPAKFMTPIGPHCHTGRNERSVVTELRAIRAKARRLMARLPGNRQEGFE